MRAFHLNIFNKTLWSFIVFAVGLVIVRSQVKSSADSVQLVFIVSVKWREDRGHVGALRVGWRSLRRRDGRRGAAHRERSDSCASLLLHAVFRVCVQCCGVSIASCDDPRMRTGVLETTFHLEITRNYF